MKPFDQESLRVTEVLEAVVIGGNVLARQLGSKKARRRVPQKQETLLRLVCEKGTAEFEDLEAQFNDQWTRTYERRKPLRAAKREFFRNIADLAARINGALVAGYQNDETRDQILKATGNVYIGLKFDHQACSVWWVETEELDSLIAALPVSSGTKHVPLTSGAIDESTIQPASTPATSEPPRLSSLELPTADSPDGDERSRPDDSEEAERLEDAPQEVTVHEDNVTGVWSFEFLGHQVEVERRHGFVKIDGHVHEASVVQGLEDVECLLGKPLRFIERLIRALEDRDALSNDGIIEADEP